jgi:hypothetical protein
VCAPSRAVNSLFFSTPSQVRCWKNAFNSISRVAVAVPVDIFQKSVTFEPGSLSLKNVCFFFSVSPSPDLVFTWFLFF